MQYFQVTKQVSTLNRARFLYVCEIEAHHAKFGPGEDYLSNGWLIWSTHLKGRQQTIGFIMGVSGCTRDQAEIAVDEAGILSWSHVDTPQFVPERPGLDKDEYTA